MEEFVKNNAFVLALVALSSLSAFSQATAPNVKHTESNIPVHDFDDTTHQVERTPSCDSFSQTDQTQIRLDAAKETLTLFMNDQELKGLLDYEESHYAANDLAGKLIHRKAAISNYIKQIQQLAGVAK